MSYSMQDVTTFVPVSKPDPAPVSPAIDDRSKDIEKGSTTHVERVSSRVEDEPHYSDDGDSQVQRSGWRRLLRKNPSKDFVNELAALNSQELDPVEVKQVERKISLLIVPALAVCYAFYYIDKTTLSYAAIFDIKKDLHLSGDEYSWLSSIFYFGWLAWAIPTNLLMAKFPLAKYLAFNILMWGVFLMAQGGVHNFTGLAILRVISGAWEATADPAFVLITGTWFTRKQQPTVIGYWYTANGVGIALGGLLGFGIGHIKGSLPSWRFEFIIIGALCSGWAAFMWLIIPDSPHDTKWLTRRQALVVVSRKRHDHAGVDKRKLQWEQARESATDMKTYLYFFLGFFANVPNGITSNFGTIIVKGFGFNTLNTTLLQIPYGTFIALMILGAIYANHKTHHLNIRTLLMAGITCLTVIGFAMLRWASGTAPRLIGYYLTGSSNAVFVLGLSLVSGNVGGTTKKALASAAIFLGVAVGNIVGPFLSIDSEAPGYKTAIIGCLVSRSMEVVVILWLRFCFVRANKHRDRLYHSGDSSADPNVRVYDDVGDKKNLRFRYIA